MANELTKAAAYVGTYAKYQKGNLSGEWMKFSDYEDYDKFMAACRELHKDEAQPEIMFQDFDYCEDLRGLVWEGGISPKLWDFIEAVDYIDMDDAELSVFASWCDWHSVDLSKEEDFESLISQFRDALQGEFNSKEDFAEELMNDLYVIPDFLENYIDYTAVARDLFLTDYEYINGYVFASY